MKKLTPLLTVDAIEPVLPFWTDGLGLEVTVRVPHPPEDPSGPLGFVILARDTVELMLQRRESVEADLGAAAPGHPELAARMADALPTLFLEVEALAPYLDRLEGVEVVVPRRQTFYGMDEIFVLAPGGVLLGLAAPMSER
ncbi:MAG: hypothetical protein RQ751_10315 [Longimicrobiales bacterium]|nr:hypothetical protein [Longimicrobiales bacterium]